MGKRFTEFNGINVWPAHTLLKKLQFFYIRFICARCIAKIILPSATCLSTIIGLCFCAYFLLSNKILSQKKSLCILWISFCRCQALSLIRKKGQLAWHHLAVLQIKLTMCSGDDEFTQGLKPIEESFEGQNRNLTVLQKLDLCPTKTFFYTWKS